jgi:hypothetical protein
VIDLSNADRFEFAQGPNARVIRTLSAAYANVVFSDQRISSIVLDNNPALLADGYPEMKIQAMTKHNGTWHGPEDLTHKPYKIWCRDARDERIEELVLVYSYAKTQRTLYGPSVELPATPDYFNPRLRVSNAGCWGWKGLVKQIIKDGTSYVQTNEAPIEFARVRLPGPAEDGVPGREYFNVKNGFIDLAGSGKDELGCDQQTSAPRTLIPANDAELLLRLNARDDPFNRTATNTGGLTLMSVTHTLDCLHTTTTVDEYQTWLTLPDEGALLSTDGRKIKGSSEVTIPTGAVIISEWDLSAVRE